jgi:hypothetical protein
MSAVWTDLITTAQSVIRALNLPGLPSGQVYARKLATDRNTTPPCILLALGGVEELLPGNFEDTEIVYPVLLIHVFASNQDYALNDTELTWRQGIIDAFLDLPRPEVTSAVVSDCQIDPRPVIDTGLFQTSNRDIGGLLLKFHTNRSRGRT